MLTWVCMCMAWEYISIDEGGGGGGGVNKKIWWGGPFH